MRHRPHSRSRRKKGLLQSSVDLSKWIDGTVPIIRMKILRFSFARNLMNLDWIEMLEYSIFPVLTSMVRTCIAIFNSGAVGAATKILSTALLWTVLSVFKLCGCQCHDHVSRDIFSESTSQASCPLRNLPKFLRNWNRYLRNLRNDFLRNFWIA